MKRLPDFFANLKDSLIRYAVLENYHGLPHAWQPETPILILCGNKEGFQRIGGLTRLEGNRYTWRSEDESLANRDAGHATFELRQEDRDFLPRQLEQQVLRRPVTQDDHVLVPDRQTAFLIRLYRAVYHQGMFMDSTEARREAVDFLETRCGLAMKPKDADVKYYGQRF